MTAWRTTTAWSSTRATLVVLAVLAACASPVAAGACGVPMSEEHARQVMARHQDALLAVPGVVGVGVGRDAATGGPELQVYGAGLSDSSRAMIPTDLEGVPVRIVETGEPRPR